MSQYLDTLSSAVEAMSVFQRMGATIFLVMTVVFFLWIVYLGFSR